MDLKTQHFQEVRAILQRFVPNTKVYAFGSRVKLTAKAHSDLDLVVQGETGLSLKQMQLLEEAFSESDLPFRVDVLDWHAISPEFREQIAAGRELIWNGSIYPD